MPVSEKLIAKITGKDNLSNTLEDIADKAQESAASFEAAQEAADSFSRSLDEVGDEAGQAERAVDKVTRSVNEATVAFTSGTPAAKAYAEALDDIDTGALEDFDAKTHTETLEQVYTVNTDEASFERARAAAESLPTEKTLNYQADGVTGAGDVESDERPLSLGGMEGLLSGRMFAPDVSLLGDLSDIRMPWQDGEIPDIPEGMESLPDEKIDIEVDDSDVIDAIAQIRTLETISEQSDIDIATDIDSSGGWLSGVRESLTDLKSTVGDIDWGEDLLPDLDGRDGDWDISLPDLGDMTWPSKPPPIPTELDIDRSPIDRLTSGITVPISYIRRKTPSAPSIGGGDGFDLDLRAGSLIPDLPDLPDMGGAAKALSSGAGMAADALSSMGSIGSKVLPKMASLASKAGSMFASLAGSIGTLPAVGVVAAGALAALAPILGTLMALITSIVAAIGGLLTAIAGLGAALAGLVGVGLFAKGEEIAQNTEGIANAMEGIQHYVKSLKDDVRQALAPIFELQGLSGFMEGFVQGGLTALQDFAEMTARLFGPIQAMMDRLGATWSAEQPEFFYELEKIIRAFMPMLEGFISWFIKSAPDALALMRKMGTKLVPKLAEMFSALWGFMEPLLPTGAAVASILIDLVTVIAELLTPINEIVALGLNPIMMSLAWAMDLLVDVVKPASDALSGLFRWFDKLIGKIMSFIKDADSIMNVLNKILWNAVIGAFETITNAVLAGINGLANAALDIIRKLPGGEEALKGLGLNDGLTAATVGFTGMKTDVNPNEPGKQTAISDAEARVEQSSRKPYQNNSGVVINGGLNVDGGSDMSERDVQYAVEDALGGSQGRRSTTGQN